ncbi:MAG: shikimate dehydrogenase [Eggerthellaceae bacterium]|nr:shikimate dehydrogenase [Eggerthellaceae bacterium]
MKELYIAGHPVTHSKSPVMHNALYEAIGLDWEYGFKDLACDEDAKRFFQDKAYLACNVTTPYKGVAFATADIQAASAKLAGGANVLINKDGCLICYNVDGKGCVGWLEMAGVVFKGQRVVVCGTGPTSLAIMNAAAEAGAHDVTLLGRDKAKCQRAVGGYLDRCRELLSTAIPMPAADPDHLSLAEAYDQVSFRFGEYGTSRRAIQEADVIIDATPLGMHEGDPAPFDTDLLHEGQAVMDVVYGHGQTALVKAAEEQGARIFAGQGMLVCQAVDTVQILFDIFSVDCKLTRREMFNIMDEAAGFKLL